MPPCDLWVELMGKKQRDCVTCGAPAGFKGRELCCLCMRRLREPAAKDRCRCVSTKEEVGSFWKARKPTLEDT